MIGGVLLTLAFWGVWGLWQEAGAHPIGWKRDTSIQPKVANISTPYGSQITSAVNDFDSNTDLQVNECTWLCPAKIYSVMYDWGDDDSAAAADSYHDGELCVPGTSNCNETDKKVNSAYINWNSRIPTMPPGYANYVARHEMGHIFGLRHVDCVTAEPNPEAFYSVMNVRCSYSVYEVLQSHDTLDINGKY